VQFRQRRLGLGEWPLRVPASTSAGSAYPARRTVSWPRTLDNPVLRTQGRVTMIDGILAAAVLPGLTLKAVSG